MTVVVGAVVISTCFCLGMLIGISVTNRHMRRRVHLNGLERQEIHAAFDELAAERALLADERWELDRRRRMLDG